MIFIVFWISCFASTIGKTFFEVLRIINYPPFPHAWSLALTPSQAVCNLMSNTTTEAYALFLLFCACFVFLLSECWVSILFSCFSFLTCFYRIVRIQKYYTKTYTNRFKSNYRNYFDKSIHIRVYVIFCHLYWSYYNVSIFGTYFK